MKPPLLLFNPIENEPQCPVCGATMVMDGKGAWECIASHTQWTPREYPHDPYWG